jgi:hypothetical protein
MPDERPKSQHGHWRHPPPTSWLPGRRRVFQHPNHLYHYQSCSFYSFIPLVLNRVSSDSTSSPSSSPSSRVYSITYHPERPAGQDGSLGSALAWASCGKRLREIRTRRTTTTLSRFVSTRSDSLSYLWDRISFADRRGSRCHVEGGSAPHRLDRTDLNLDHRCSLNAVTPTDHFNHRTSFNSTSHFLSLAV